MIWGIISVIMLTWYGYQLWDINKGWSKELQRGSVKNIASAPISIIIPFRAPNDDLLRLVTTLQNQLRQDQLILVYDGDKVLESKWQYIQNQGKGKKAAITTGVEEAVHDWIVLLDDDVEVGDDFISTWRNTISSSDAYLLSGWVYLKAQASTWVQKFQEIEYTTLQVVGVGKIGTGYPKLLSAANLAFKKSAFKDVEGYEGNAHIASGDDVFLLMKILSAFGAEKISSNTSINSMVTTPVKETIKEAFQQKKRWTGKIENYPNKKIQRWSQAVGVVNIMMLSWMVLALFTPLFWVLVAIKVLLDTWIFNKGNSVFKGSVSKWMLLTSGMVYPWYILGLVIASFRAKKKELKAPSKLKW